MRRLALAIVLLALTAEPAAASRSYGILDPGRTLLTFEFDGDHVRAAAMRTRTFCDDGDTFFWAANYRIARRARVGDDYLIRRGPGRYRIVGDYKGRDALHWRGVLTITDRDARKPRVHFKLTQTDRVSTCTSEFTRLARREPGVLYTGATDDDEPVWLRMLPEGVEWVAGYGHGCGRDGFMEGFHTDLLPLTGPATFGRPGLIGGFTGGGYDQSVAIEGRFTATEATGTQRLVGDGVTGCDTGARGWRAGSS